MEIVGDYTKDKEAQLEAKKAELVSLLHALRTLYLSLSLTHTHTHTHTHTYTHTYTHTQTHAQVAAAVVLELYTGKLSRSDGASMQRPPPQPQFVAFRNNYLFIYSLAMGKWVSIRAVWMANSMQCHVDQGT